MSVILSACPLCGHKKYLIVYHLKEYDILKCRQCGLLTRDKKLSLNKIKNLYSKKYFLIEQKAYFAPCLNNYSLVKKENFRIQDFITRLKKLNNLVRDRKKTLFDIGCATGTFLEICREAGWEVAGNDISHFAISKARKNNLQVWESTMEDHHFNGMKYHAVTGWEVVPNFEKPDVAFNKIRKMLKTKGILAIQLTVVDSIIFYLSDWVYRLSGGRLNQLVNRGYPVNHAYHFSRKTLKKFLKKYGFKLEKEENIEFNFRLSYFPKVLLPILNLVSIIAKLTGKTTQYRVYARKI